MIHTTLFLARCQDWAHADGTAPVRVHLALTTPDENGDFWAVRGTTRHDNRRQGQAVRVNRTTFNNLKMDTTFVTTREGLVQLNVRNAGRKVGQIEETHFNQIWDQIEAK